MIRYFFDIRTTEQSLLDYRGQEFGSQRSALDYAEAIAYDLKHSLNDSWIGWSVDVRDVAGNSFFTLPVEAVGLKAA